MSSKRETLATLTREQLKGLAKQYGIPFEHSWTKEQLVESIASSHSITIDGIKALHPKIASGDDVAATVRSARQDWYQETVVSAFSQVKDLYGRISEAIALKEATSPGYVTDLLARTSAIKAAKLITEEVPDHVGKQLSSRQWTGVKLARALCRQVPRQLDPSLQQASQNPNVRRLIEIRARNLPTRIEYYATQAAKSYAASCYDASIVMLARALENLLKHHLTAKGKAYRKEATLGALLGVYRKEVADQKVLEKILEVSNMDRIISAHDIAPFDQQMAEVDAQHAWTAFDIALRELPP